MEKYNIGDLVCYNFGSKKFYGVVLYVDPYGRPFCPKNWPRSIDKAKEKANEWLMTRSIPINPSAKESLNQDYGLSCSVSVEIVERNFMNLQRGMAGPKVSQSSTCTCTHSFLIKGCTCGFVNPYKSKLYL